MTDFSGVWTGRSVGGKGTQFIYCRHIYPARRGDATFHDKKSQKNLTFWCELMKELQIQQKWDPPHPHPRLCCVCLSQFCHFRNSSDSEESVQFFSSFLLWVPVVSLLHSVFGVSKCVHTDWVWWWRWCCSCSCCLFSLCSKCTQFFFVFHQLVISGICVFSPFHVMFFCPNQPVKVPIDSF